MLLVLTCIPSVTRAYDGGFGSGLGMRGFGASGSLYGLGYMPVPPYFAMHPPVYYGQRVFRTYGESPFARPARSSRPFNVSVQLVRNPFVAPLPIAMPSAPAAGQETSGDQVAVQPKMIVNPFYKVDSELARK